MSLTAKTKTDIICSLDYKSSSEIRVLYPDLKELTCPECDSVVFPRSRTNYVNHFVHSIANDNCSLSNESLEHQLSKIYIYNTLKEIVVNGKVFCEYPIYQDSKLIARADVMLLFGENSGIAFEVQLSNISLAEIQKRTSNYYANGFDVQWILGDNFSNNDVKYWLKEEGSFVTISSYKEIVTVSANDYLQQFAF